MATDTTNFTPDMNSNSADNEPNFDAVQLAQAGAAGAPVQVVIPAGANVVRVPVTAGETIELPFGADAHLLGKLGDNGNLAIKVGDITVILEGYTAAEGQQPVIIETAEGKPVDVATVLAATDPNLDIQTAAGGAEGAQGADNTGAIFEAFGPGNGIGGFGAVGALGATELNYKLIDTEAKFFLEGNGEPGDTHPTPTNNEGQVDEDGKKHLHENPFDDCYGGINTDPQQPGDDPWPAKVDIHIVDYGPDGFGSLIGNPGDGICRAHDDNGNLVEVYSHGEPVLLRWNAVDGRLEGYVEHSTECDGCERLVFTVTPIDGGLNGDVCFKLLGPLDHPYNTDQNPDVDVLTLADAETGDGTSGDGDGCCDPYAKWHEFEDNLVLDLHFDAKDGDDVTATDIPVQVNVDDDSPAFLDCNFDPCQGITIVADETHGVQCGTDDVDVTLCFLQAVAGEQVEPGESTIFDKFVCFFGYDAVQNLDICDITAAQKYIKFGYGADGPLVHEICCDGGEGNPEVPALQSLGKQEGYGQNGDCIINCGALLTNSCGDVWFCEDTKLTITVGDCEETHTLCVKMEGFGNTIFGYAEDYSQQSIQGGEGGGSCKIPVFIITIDPDTKELTYVQLHQINNDNPWDPNEANDGGEGSCHVLEQINIGLAVTDYDHDSIWTPVHVTILDDGPKLKCVTYDCVEDIYHNDFSSDDLKGGELIDGVGGTPYAIITGGSLQLTDESFSHNDSQWLKIDGGSEFHGSFNASFDVILNDTGAGDSADGFSFQVGNDVNTSDLDGIGAEEPNTSGFALTFDTFDNGSPDVKDEIAVWFNGVKLDSRADLGDLNSLSPLNVSVEVQGSHYSVTINGTEYFHGNLGGTIPSDADFYIGARTGGAADIQGVDNICITAPCTEAHVDEDFLHKGNHDTDGGPGAHGDDEGSVCATGQVHVDFGRDQPGHFCLDKLTITDDKGCVVFDGCHVDNLYTSKGEHVDIEFCGDKVIGTACGRPVFTLTIDCDGNFKFELCQALEHPLHNDPSTEVTEKNFEDNLHFDFGVKAIDCDGDAVCTEIKVDVDDDAPQICGVCYISQDTGYQESQETLVSRGGQIISCEFGSVDEDFLPAGNHDKDTNPDNIGSPYGVDGNNGDDNGGTCVTGHINGKVGADQPGTYSFNIPGLCLGGEPVETCLKTSNGDHPISLVLCQEGCNWVVKGVYDCNGEQEGGQEEAFRVTLDSKCGDFKFELEAALEHPDTNGNHSDDNWDNGFSRYEDNLCLNFGVKLTDSDGDSACTTLKFQVDDDAPVICDVTYHNQNTGQPVLVKVDGGEGSTTTKYGEVDEDFLPKGNHDHDTNPDNLNNPYGDGNNGDGPGGLCVFGQIHAKIGADQPGSFLFNIPGLCESGDIVETCLKTSNGDHPISLQLCQEGCNWVVKGVFDCNGDAEGGEAEAFRITLDSKTGCFKFELEAALEHPDSNGNPADNHWDDGFARYEDDICLNFGVKVVDSDGDAVCTTLTFKVDDDAPVICDVTYHNQNTGVPTLVVVDGAEGHTGSKYGEVDEDFLPKGNHDKDTNPDNLNNPYGDGNNGDGPGGTCVTGCINAKIGADQPGSFLFDIKGLCESGDTIPTCLKTSNGDHPISLVLCQEGCNWVVKGIFDCNGDAEGGQSEAFRVTLDSKTGEFKFELEAALQHPDSNGNPADNHWDDGVSRYEDDICLDFGVKVVDSDGDAAKTCLTFKVDDDAPIICGVTYHNQNTGEPVEVRVDGGEGHTSSKYGEVDEDFLPKGNHDKDTNPDNLNHPFGDGNNGDGPGGLCVTGCIEAKIGADQPGSFLFDIPGLCKSGDTVETCLKTSNGDHPISLLLCQDGCNWIVKGIFDCNGDAPGGQSEAFRVTLDSITGQFKFELEAALEHPDTNGNPADNKWDDGFARYEDDICLDFHVKVVDSDGDAAKTCLTFKVDDDAPIICDVTYHNQETGQPEVQILTDGGEGTPEPKAQYGQVDEDWLPNGNHDKDTNPDNLNNPFGDGNNGDGPGGTCVIGCITAKIGADQPGSFLFNIPGLCESGDSVESCYKTSEGYPITLTLCQEGCNWIVKGTYVDGTVEQDPTEEAFRITLDSKTGQFKFELETALQHPDSNGDHSDDKQDDGTNRYEDDLFVKFDVKVVDSDGDAAKTCLIFKVDDDAPVQCRVPDWTVDEDAHHSWDSWEPGHPLAGGIEGGPGDSATDWIGFKDNLGVKFGADGPSANPYGFAGVEGAQVTATDSNSNSAGLTSGGVPVTYHWDAGTSTLTGVAGALQVFIVHIDQSNGDFDFLLTGPVDHPFNADGAKVPGVSSWEDELNLDLQFTATDADGDAAIAHVTVRIDDDSPQLDGTSCYTTNLIQNGSFEDTSSGLHIDHGSWQTYSDLPGGWTAEFPGEQGYIEVQHQGTVGLTPFEGANYIELDSADSAGGNSADNSHVFQDINLQPDDVSGDFLLTFAYSPRSQDPADTSDVEVWFGGNLITTITGGTVGQWTEYSLLVHGNGDATQRLEFRGAGTNESIGGFIDNVGLKCVVSVDEDASLDPGNRAPGIEGGPGDDGVNGHCATGNLGVAFGADGPGGINFDPTCQPTDLKSHGETVQYESDGKGGLIAFIATGHETIFTLTVQDNGDFKFDLVRPLDHPGHDADGKNDGPDTSYEDNLLFDLHFVATDNDGDAVKGSITINVDDDSPTVDGGEAPCIAPCDTREEQAHEHFNVDASMITAFDHNGDPATVVINGNGFGVASDSDGGDGGRFDEVNYVGDGATGFPTDSELLLADFGGKVASGADVDLSVFFGSEGAVGNEQGAYQLFLDGKATGEWHIFTANSGSGLLSFHINPDAGSDGFDQIKFVAIPGTADPDGNDAGDSSDYSIKNIAVDLKACAQSEGDFSFGYGADGPGSVKLVQPNPQDPAFALTSHDQPITYIVAPDGQSMTGVINGDQVVFELTINPDTGKFHFYLYEPIEGLNEGDIHIPFQVQVTDYDGDAVSATIQVCVEQDRPTPPIFEDETTILDEDGLPGGNNPDTTTLQNAINGDLIGGHQEGGLPAVPSEAISRDSLNINWQGDVGTVKFSLTDAQLADIHPLSGAVLTTANVSGNDTGDIKVWDGTPGASNLILEVKLIDAATSVFEAQLYQPIKHTVNGTEDTKNLPVTVTAENSGGPVSHELEVRINDDLPIAQNTYQTLSATGVDTNLMIVLDISGSMGDNSGLTALDRLDAARAAINELFEQYDSAGNVSVKIVTFSTGAGEEPGGWHTLAEAKAFLDTLSPGGTTNYGAAIAQAEAAFAESGKIVGGQNVSYFVSDGKPNPAATGLDAGEQAAWESFVSTNHIVSQAIGIGTGVSATELNPIAYDGVHNTQIPSIIVTDLNNLTAALVGTISGGVSGDLDGSPSKFGADGGFVQSVNVNGSVFTYNAAANTVGGLGAGSSYDTTTHILSVHTSALDGAFALNLLDGSYNYIRSSDPNKSGSEVITYTLSDNDGDQANGSAIITVPSVDLAPIGRDDHIITNINDGGGNENINVTDASLLWNDSDANHDALSITGISNISGLNSVIHTAPNVFIVDGSNGGSFDYTLTANTKTDTAHVDVDRSQAGDNTLDGDGLDNVLVDRDGQNDTLKGYEGRDALIGGTGDTTFIGGTGDDLIDLSKGGNDTVRIETKLDGNDLLVGFSTGNAASNDQVNLDTLFDNYGAMSGTRADHVTTTQVGGDVSVNVDTDNNTGNGFEMHITIQGVTLANIQTGVSGGDNEVILGS